MSDEIAELQQELAALQRRYQKSRRIVAKNRKAVGVYHQITDIERSLNHILQLSLQRIPLVELLEIILREILNVPWIALKKSGCIFLVSNDDAKTLTMRAHYDLSPALLEQCQSVPFGHCLCGQAAMSASPIFKDRVDTDHLVSESQPHGHHILPLVAKGEVLGVLNLYVREEHVVTGLEKRFLESISAILTGIILNKQYEQTLAQQSSVDDLTGLPNRRSLIEHMVRTIDRTSRSSQRFALYFLDLDGFKPVNDTYGHNTGDLILKTFSDRIKENLRSMDLLARLGGDEFVIVTELMTSRQELIQFGHRIIQITKQPIRINGVDIQIGVSIGISIYPDHGTTPEELLQKADEAMYAAKSQGDYEAHVKISNAL